MWNIELASDENRTFLPDAGAMHFFSGVTNRDAFFSGNSGDALYITSSQGVKNTWVNTQ